MLNLFEIFLIKNPCTYPLSLSRQGERYEVLRLLSPCSRDTHRPNQKCGSGFHKVGGNCATCCMLRKQAMAKCVPCAPGEYKAGTNDAPACEKKRTQCGWNEVFFPGSDAETATDDTVCLANCENGYFRAGKGQAVCRRKQQAADCGTNIRFVKGNDAVKDRDDTQCLCLPGWWRNADVVGPCRLKMSAEGCKGAVLHRYVAGDDSVVTRDDSYCACEDKYYWDRAPHRCVRKRAACNAGACGNDADAEPCPGTAVTAPFGYAFIPGVDGEKASDDTVCVRVCRNGWFRGTRLGPCTRKRVACPQAWQYFVDGDHAEKTRDDTQCKVPGWKTLFSRGAAFAPHTELGRDDFNRAFQTQWAPFAGIARRECPTCPAGYRDIYFKQLTNPTAFDAWCVRRRPDVPCVRTSLRAGLLLLLLLRRRRRRRCCRCCASGPACATSGTHPRVVRLPLRPTQVGVPARNQ